MKKFITSFILGFFLVCHLSCSALIPDSIENFIFPSTSEDTCSSDDLTCFLDNIILYAEDGEEIELVPYTEPLPAASDLEAIPIITNQPSSLTISDPSEITPLFIEWENPHSNQPTFCMSVCPKDEECEPTAFLCAQSEDVDSDQGAWQVWIGISASLDEESDSIGFDLNITPVATPNAYDPLDLFDMAISNDQNLADIDSSEVIVGNSVTIPQTVSTTNESEEAEETVEITGTACTYSGECSVTCVSTRNCIIMKGSSNCNCTGTVSPGVCSSSACNMTGGACGDGVNFCCGGYSCNNGVCEAYNGICPFDLNY